MSQSKIFNDSDADPKTFLSLSELREMLGLNAISRWRFDPLARDLTLSEIDHGSDDASCGRSQMFVAHGLDQAANRVLLITAIEAEMKRNGPCRLDWPMILPNGETCWIRFAGSRERVGIGYPEEVHGIIFDVDEERRSEALQRRHRESLAAIVRVLPLATIVVDAAMRIQFLNAPAERFLECSAQEVFGQSFSRFAPRSVDILHGLFARAVDNLASAGNSAVGIVEISRGHPAFAPMTISVTAARNGAEIVFVLALASSEFDDSKIGVHVHGTNGHVPGPGAMPKAASAITAPWGQIGECTTPDRRSPAVLDDRNTDNCIQSLIQEAAAQVLKAAQILQSVMDFAGGADRHARDPARDPAADRFKHLVAQLTPREREVLRQVIAGRKNKEIGRDLAISPRTVEAYRSKIMAKINCQSVPELVRVALLAGFVD